MEVKIKITGERRCLMADRNTRILREIIEILAPQLADKTSALAQLEDHFKRQYLVNAGDVQFVASAAEQLRLRITREECSMVLDHIASKGMVGITVDVVEQAINGLLGEDRFIEQQMHWICADPSLY